MRGGLRLDFSLYTAYSVTDLNVSVPESISILKRIHILKMMYSPKNSTSDHQVSQLERMCFMMKLMYF